MLIDGLPYHEAIDWPIVIPSSATVSSSASGGPLFVTSRMMVGALTTGGLVVTTAVWVLVAGAVPAALWAVTTTRSVLPRSLEKGMYETVGIPRDLPV